MNHSLLLSFSQVGGVVHNGGGEYRGVGHALRSIYLFEGVANGLFKGLSLALLKGPVQSAIGFAVNDYAKKALS